MLAGSVRLRRPNVPQRHCLALDVFSGTRSAAQVARDEGVIRKSIAAQVGIARDAVYDALLTQTAGIP